MKFNIKEIRDFFFFGPTAGRAGGETSDPAVKQASETTRGLKVTLKASHAGMVNGNYLMYSPQGMKDSTHTWVWPHPRPVQIHHDDHSDPVGRVIGARYIPYGPTEIPEEDSLTLASFIQEAKKKEDVIEAANILQESGVLDSDEWRGVGELELEAVISDSGAIQKILDGRYLGVSVGVRPQSALCSICGKDWIKEEGSCEHERGEIDEDSGKKMFLIVGDSKYFEVSYVNRPADEHAITAEALSIDSESSAEGTAFLDSFPKIPVSFEFIDTMFITDEQQEELDPKKDPYKALEKEILDEKNSSEETNPEKEEISDEEILEGVEQSEEEEVSEEETSEEEEEPTLEKTVKEALRLLFEEEDSFTEEHAEIINEAIEELIEEDAKLTAKKRKALPGKVFCGPQKSFPVNDCAHYTSALRLLGRYKGSGSKTEIRSCIMSRGKALGCSSEKSKDSEQNLNPCLDSLDLLENDKLSELYLDIEKLMVARQLKAPRECSDCAEKEEKVQELFPLKEKNEDLEDRLSLFREEWHQIIAEHIESENSHSETLSELEDAFKKVIKLYKRLTDKEIKEEDLEKEVNSLSLDELRSLIQEVNFDSFVTFFNSGLSAKPEEEVSIEDAEPIKTKKVKNTTDEETKDLAEQLLSMRKRGGKEFAQRYLDELIRRKRLPEDFTLAKAETLWQNKEQGVN